MELNKELTQVWKYELQSHTELEIPKGSEILSVANQNEKVCMWVRVNPVEDEHDCRSFRVYGTGQWVPSGEHVFVGTVLLSGGSLVFHVFETSSWEINDV